MGTIADKLTYLGETKSDLRATLNGLLGLSLDETTPFRRYAYEADMAAVRAMFTSGELGGYWEPTLGSYYEDSAGTTAASLNGVVGAWANQLSGGPSAIRSTTANKPYLRKTPQTNRYWLDGNTSTANLTATFSSSLGSNCTIARLDPELGVRWSESQTIGTTYNLITPFAYHGPMLIINRALTAGEKAIVDRVMNRFMPQLGPELYQNPSFDTDATWGRSGNWSISGGAANSGIGASGNITQNVTFNSADQVLFVANIVGAVSGSGFFHPYSPTYQIGTFAHDAPRFLRVGVIPNLAMPFNIGARASSSANVTLSSVSARRIL